MASTIQTELRVPADAKILRLVQDYAHGLAQLAGLPEDQAESFALAVGGVCQNSIQHAYEGEEAGTLKLVGALSPAALTLSLHVLVLGGFQNQQSEGIFGKR